MGIKGKEGKKGETLSITKDLFPKSIFNYPVFCFKYLCKGYHIDDCDKDEKIKLLDKLCMFSSMTWQQIQFAPRHGLGAEKIAQGSINTGIPAHITPDVTLYALRFDGKKPIVGYKSDFIFHLLYIDRGFTLYNH